MLLKVREWVRPAGDRDNLRRRDQDPMRDVTPLKGRGGEAGEKERKVTLIAIQEDLIVQLIGRKLTNKCSVFI